MAKIFAPLHSLTASGKFARLITFSQRQSGSQCRYQRSQKDVITTKRTAQRNNFLVGRDMWSVLDAGVAECGFVLCGGQDVDLYLLPCDQLAPQFARFVGDVIKDYF